MSFPYMFLYLNSVCKGVWINLYGSDACREIVVLNMENYLMARQRQLIDYKPQQQVVENTQWLSTNQNAAF